MHRRLEHARRELDIARRLYPDSKEYQHGDLILNMIELLDKQNLSIRDAFIAVRVFNTLINGFHLTRLSGDDSEWRLLSDGFYQNIRSHGRVYKDETGYAFDIWEISSVRYYGKTLDGSVKRPDCKVLFPHALVTKGYAYAPLDHECDWDNLCTLIKTQTDKRRLVQFSIDCARRGLNTYDYGLGLKTIQATEEWLSNPTEENRLKINYKDAVFFGQQSTMACGFAAYTAYTDDIAQTVEFTITTSWIAVDTAAVPPKEYAWQASRFKELFPEVQLSP